MALSSSGAYGADLEPYYPKSRAPVNVQKGAKAPMGALTPADIAELKGEFGGLLYMGKQAFTFARWPGKEMADCEENAGGHQCGRCELIMGNSSAEYYFYRSNGGCTLQQIDAKFQASDSSLLKALRGTAQQLLGRSSPGSKSNSSDPGWDGSGQGWVWKDSEDLAYLYMDTAQASENTEGIARFQWRRVPLYKPSY